MSDIDVSVEGRLTGKVVIVTGAGQTPGDTMGNGKAIAVLCARAGAKVLCVDRDGDRAQATVDMITGEGGIAQACAADISKKAGADKAVADCLAAFGQLDGLVNNVGIGGGGDGPVHATSEDAFDRIMTVNLKSALLCSQAALGVMRDQKSGAIVNISSLAAIAGSFQTAYELSKAAMNRMTESIALANAKRGIRCNAVMAGMIDTPMAVDGIAKATGVPADDVRAARNKQVPMGHMGSAWDIAHAALFLLSEEARFISGVLLRVDGAHGVKIG